MKRDIAILALTLTAAQAFAIYAGECASDIQQPLNELIAIIAFEDDPEDAYLTLRDMGFSDDEAYDMVTDCQRGYVTDCQRGYVTDCQRSFVNDCQRGYVNDCQRGYIKQR